MPQTLNEIMAAKSPVEASGCDFLLYQFQQQKDGASLHFGDGILSANNFAKAMNQIGQTYVTFEILDELD